MRVVHGGAMIPWVREKFAERRARWLASRKRNDDTNPNINTTASISTFTTSSIATTSASSPAQNSTITSRRVNEKQKLTSTSKLKSDDTNITSTPPSTSRGAFRKVKVFSPTGKLQIISIGVDAKLTELKQQAIEKFSQTPGSLPIFATDTRQLYMRFRLVRPDSTVEMNESLTLEEVNAKENEVFLLTLRRLNQLNNVEHMRGPTQEDIRTATKDIPSSASSPPRVDINELVLQSDLQFDVRKVLISLAMSSAYIIGAGPFANRLISMLRQRLLNKRKHQNDTIQCLVEMGFSKEKVVYALKINNGVYASALDWLVENENAVQEIPEDDTSQMTSSTSKSLHAANIAENIEALLDIVRTYSHRDVPPPPEMVRSLIDMGFTEMEVVKALKMTRNNQSAACEWLCGNRSTSLTELRDGLSNDSPILKAMMESPQVQMSLNNPKMFIAYLSMLENHNALSMWLGDNDTSSVLSHILRKYHEEKHILGINQFNNAR